MAFSLRSLVSRAFYTRIVRADRVPKALFDQAPRPVSQTLYILHSQHRQLCTPRRASAPSAQCQFKPSKFSCFKCWSCEHVAQGYSFFCDHCHTVQPPCQHCNYFEYFNCPTTFDLNLDRLAARYKDLQRHLHPDIFSKKSKEEQILSLQQSAMVNDAYNILKQPYSRAAYLVSHDYKYIRLSLAQLKLHGLEVDQDSQSIADPDLLGTVMDLREAIEEADTVGTVDTLERTVRHKHDECIAALKDAFAVSDLPRAREWTIALKYYTKLLDELDNKRLRVR